jgi:hypothetical protein
MMWVLHYFDMYEIIAMERYKEMLASKGKPFVLHHA